MTMQSLVRRVCTTCYNGFDTTDKESSTCQWCERDRTVMPRDLPLFQPVLDYGHVKYIEHWGSDERVIEGARQSTRGGFVSWDAYENHPKGDAGLLAYLWREKHVGPFEMCGMTLQIMAPVVVFRQWHRHRTQSYDEMSGRYTVLPELDYVPSIQRLNESITASANKQASGSGKHPGQTALESWQARLRAHLAKGREIYHDGLDLGISKEVSRFALGVTMYSQMWASGNLRNWLHFLNLRKDPHAQWEIRQFAYVVDNVVKSLFPRTFQLYNDNKTWFKSDSKDNQGK